MLMKEVALVARQAIKLVGYSVEASLNDDIEGAIVNGLREQLFRRMAEIPRTLDTGMMLVQVYPDGEWTPAVAFTHIVGVEVDTVSTVPAGMVTHFVPEGTYLRFIHQGDEQSMDATYIAVNEWLEQHGYANDRAFDLEHWLHPGKLQSPDNTITLWVPVS